MSGRTGTAATTWPARVLGVVIVVMGLALAAGGIRLLTEGGSSYFLWMGLALLVAGGLMVARRALGAQLYAVAFVLTVVWALADVGLDYWGLVSRLMMFACIGVLVGCVYPGLRRFAGNRAGVVARGLTALVALACVATFVSMFWKHDVIRHQDVIDTAAAGASAVPAAPHDQWTAWAGTTAGTHYSALDAITKANVGTLKVAWTFRTGDIPVSNGFGAEDQNTPLQVGDTVYVCTPHNQVFALDADTGTRRWSFDPKASVPNWQRCRGLAYYTDDGHASMPAPASSASMPASAPMPVALASDAAVTCQSRIIETAIDARLIELDASSGQPCEDFGTHGVVDLKKGMGLIKPGYYTLTAAPLVAGHLIVVGGRVADNIETGEPPGVVRAYDVRSGHLVWSWDAGVMPTSTVPASGKYVRDTPNVWSAMAYDPKLGMIYMPTGNTTPDQWGGERSVNDDRTSSSIVALDVNTGAERWTFQTTHHDLWDYDLPAQPALYDVPDGKGGSLPALVQVTKQGQIFMLNRATGKPLAKVVERPVQQGNAKGERYSPTQPFSVGMPSIGTKPLTESRMWGATPFDQLICRIAFKKMRYGGPFTPPGEDLSLQWPGSLGGMNWGGVSIDEAHGLMFVNDMRLGLWTRLIPRDAVKGNGGGVEMGLASMYGTPYWSDRNRFMSPLGIPCQEPPFGTMTAISLASHEIAWQVPVGTVQDTGPLGVKMHLPIPVGMPTLGASLSTKSGLVFFAGTQDYYLRAFDESTGKEVWKARLPVGSQGGPMTYVSPKSGRQFVLVTAGGARQSPDRGDYVIAYALPEAAATP